MKALVYLGCVLFIGHAAAAESNAARDILMWEADGKIQHGDLSPIEAAFQRRDLPALWRFFDQAVTHQYGYGRTRPEGLELKKSLTRQDIDALNLRIRAYAGQFLVQIPGHAKMLGDEIDASSDVPANLASSAEHARIHNMLSLQWLASPEAIQQIARFLDDERNPHAELSSGSTRPMSNRYHAIYALDQALGKKSPLEKTRSSSGILDPEQMKELKSWWNSNASLAYRQPLPGVALPVYRHYDYKRTVPLEKNGQTLSEEQRSMMWIWGIWLCLLLVAVLYMRARARDTGPGAND